MRMIRNRLTASGRPFHLAGHHEEHIAGSWLHHDYLSEQVEVSAGNMDSRQSVMLGVIPERGNPYDSNAVAVSFNNRHIGYLPAAVARVYSPLLVKLIEQGFVPFVQGQIYARWLPANEEYPVPKKWVTVDLYVEDIDPQEPIPVWNIQGTRELAAQGAGLLDYKAESYWASAEGHELDALRDFESTFEGEYAVVRLTVLPSSRPNNSWRVAIQHNGTTLGRLSAVSSNRYRVHLLAAEASGMKLAAVIRVAKSSQRDGCSVLIPRELERLPNGCPVADYKFHVEKPSAPFKLSGEVADLPEVRLDFETVHTLEENSDLVMP